MARFWERTVKAVCSIALSLIALVAGIFPATIPVSAKASALTFEQTNVLDDLKNAKIHGEDFSLLKYGFNAFKETQVLTFVEYCYSFYQNKQDNYGLYVYVYNPKGLYFDVDHELNSIQLAYGLTTSTNYHKYPLEYLNCSIEPNYERLFYKFKVVLTSEEKQVLMQALNSSERVYRISSVELMETGKTNATDFAVGTTYRYSGYSAGYGSNPSAENTLVCESEQADVLSLKVAPTAYRPKGTNGTNNYTQDCLHSVYFAVPNDFIARYGQMTAVHAIWKNAVTSPIFVTGNETVYNQVTPLLGDYVHGGFIEDDGKNNDMDYALIATKAQIGYRDTVEAAMAGYIAYNSLMDYCGIDAYTYYDEVLHYLYYAYYAENGDADSYTVSATEILNALKHSAIRYGGELVNGKYSRKMFSSVDEEFTEAYIQAEDNFNLTSQTISQTWWEKLWGLDGSVVDSTSFNGIQAIYPIKASDLEGTAKEVSQRLYVDEADVAALKTYFNQNNGLATVYLFRYMQTEYVAYEVTEYKHVEDWALIGGYFNTYEVADTNAYFAKTSVQLDFDIIDVTFSNGTTETVIPVVSDPIDIVPDVTPPVYTTTDEKIDWLKLLKITIALSLVVVLLIFLWPLVKPLFVLIGKGIAWLVTAPFKAIGQAIKKRKERKEDDEENG